MRPGAARTATVIIDGSDFEARVISAHEFQGLMAKYETFRERLHVVESTMNRKNIDLLGKSKGSFRNTWTWASIVFGAVVGLLVGIWLGLGGSPIWSAILSAIGAGALSTLVAMRMNPDLIYRNMYWLSGAAMIAQTVQTVFSLSFSVDGTQNQLPLLWNFNSNPEQKWWVVLIIYFSLVALALMSWLADRDIRRNSSKSE